jgi:hypothetical protein
MGNSEVGHNALGAGRVFAQGSKLVNAALETRSLFRGETWRWLVDGVRESGEPLHFLGLLSDGNVHSHEQHLHALLAHARRATGVRACASTRSRTAATSARRRRSSTSTAWRRCWREINANGERDYRIASGGGRMFITMDRYNAEWSMVQRGWAMHVRGPGAAVRQCGRGHCDLSGRAARHQRSEPAGVRRRRTRRGALRTHPGRRERLSLQFPGGPRHRDHPAFEDAQLDAFDRGPVPRVRYAGMMQYDGDLELPARFLVDPPVIDRTLGEYLVAQRRDATGVLRDAEVRSRDLLLERQSLRLHRRAAREIRGDSQRRDQLRSAAVDEGRRDHGRRADRAADGALAPRAPELRQRRHGGPHGRSRGRGDGRAGGRPLSRSASARPGGDGWGGDRHRRSRQRGRDVRARQEGRSSRPMVAAGSNRVRVTASTRCRACCSTPPGTRAPASWPRPARTARVWPTWPRRRWNCSGTPRPRITRRACSPRAEGVRADPGGNSQD